MFPFSISMQICHLHKRDTNSTCHDTSYPAQSTSTRETRAAYSFQHEFRKIPIQHFFYTFEINARDKRARTFLSPEISKNIDTIPFHAFKNGIFRVSQLSRAFLQSLFTLYLHVVFSLSKGNKNRKRKREEKKKGGAYPPFIRY